MHPPDADTVVVRYGDLGVKSSTVRDRMEGRLCDHLAALLDDRCVAGEVAQRWGRPLIRTSPDAVEAALGAAADCFGVVSASAATTVEPTMEAITGELARIAPHVAGAVAAGGSTADGPTAAEAGAGGAGWSYAVRARRAGDAEAHPFTSEDLEERGGSAVWTALEDRGVAPRVDLEDPDVTFGVDCRSDEAYVFTDRVEGPGGLPLGSQAPLVALVSGGIDSPVAAWRAMRRGSRIVPLYLDLGGYGGADHRARAEATVRRLARYAPGLALRVAPAGDAVARLADATGNDRMVQFRRFMLRVAAHVADREGCAGIVTGGALGQKSSQTAANLAAVDAAVDLPVHRPLLTMDKREIVAAARRIGTYDDATVDAGCVALAPDRPVTAADPDVVADSEPDWLAAAARDVADDVETVALDAGGGEEREAAR